MIETFNKFTIIWNSLSFLSSLTNLLLCCCWNVGCYVSTEKHRF